jgi:DNA-binding ferritin-like protein (Dps family)
MEVSEEEQKTTYKSRMLRLNVLKEEVKKNQKMLQDELLKFGMKRWMMSRPIVQKYIDELVECGVFKRFSVGPVYEENYYIELAV